MRPRWQAVAAVMALIAPSVAGLGGCGKPGARDADKGPATAGGGAGAPPRVATGGRPPTDQECRDFAEVLGAAVRSGDAAALDRMIDWDTMIEAATAGIDAPERFRKGLLDNVKQSGRESDIIDSSKKGGSYTFLRVRTRDGRPSVLFRLVPPDGGGFNYHEYVLACRPDGRVKAVDLYVFITGELLSQTLRRGFVQAVAHTSRGLLESLTGSDQEYFQHYARLEQMARSVKDRQYREALSLYRTLPPELKKDKSALLIRLQAAQQAQDDREYSRVIEDFRHEYPGDPCIDILSIDYHILRKEYPQALACLDRLDRAVGGDPFLRISRAGIHVEQDDLQAAREDLQEAIAEEPTRKDAYEGLLTIAIQERKFDETLGTLRLLKQRFHVRFPDLTKLPLYKEFVKSPQYREWLREEKGGENVP